LRLGGWGSHKLPQRVRAEPGRQTYLVRLGINLHLSDCLMAINFLCLLSVKRKFP